MDIDTRYNNGPVQVASSRPEENGPSDPAAFIQDLANKVCRPFVPSQDVSLSSLIRRLLEKDTTPRLSEMAR
jgi:hypothetical protein